MDDDLTPEEIAHMELMNQIQCECITIAQKYGMLNFAQSMFGICDAYVRLLNTEEKSHDEKDNAPRPASL